MPGLGQNLSCPAIAVHAILGLYTLLVISPMFAWDLYRLRRVHKAYFIWLAMFVSTTIVIHVLWGSPWWFATARHLVRAS